MNNGEFFPQTGIIAARCATDLSDIDDDSVALTVTSPPYWNAIDYDRHADDAGSYYRSREYGLGYRGYEEYLDWLVAIMGGVRAKTRPGGVLALVVGTVLLDGTHYPLPMDLTGRLLGEGWAFRQDIIWHKVTAGVRRAGTFIQHPYPGYFHPNIMTEYILLFTNPGPKIFARRTRAEKRGAIFPIDDLFTREIANNVWHIPPVPPGHLDHPCPFPEEIPYRLMRLYTYPDDLVLDPFNGSGQTTKVAHHLGRRYIGYDIQEEYSQLAATRLREPLAIRRRALVARFEHLGRELPRDDS